MLGQRSRRLPAKIGGPATVEQRMCTRWALSSLEGAATRGSPRALGVLHLEEVSVSLLQALVHQASQQGASDLHLEPGLPPTLRVHGQLRPMEGALSPDALQSEASRLLPGDLWAEFEARRSADLSLVLAGVRCRIHVLRSARGVGLAVRLLHPFQATLETLNLHPDLAQLTTRSHGLIVVTGATGSGKSSTIAALIEEINRARPCHVVTLEQPIEHAFRPRRAFIRQREVGRDTPSFQQGLVDALREDPDVLVVGEVREAETIRLALLAAETGHLVITTLHAGTPAEALSRIIGSFAPEAQPAVQASLAECLVAVVAQRLVLRPEIGVRVPECEVLVSNDAVRASVRQGMLVRIPSLMQLGGTDGMWTLERWRRWQDTRERWFVRSRDAAREPLPEDNAAPSPAPFASPPAYAPAPYTPPREPAPALRPRAAPPPRAPARASRGSVGEDGVLDLDGDHGDLASILKDL